MPVNQVVSLTPAEGHSLESLYEAWELDLSRVWFSLACKEKEDDEEIGILVLIISKTLESKRQLEHQDVEVYEVFKY